MSSYNLLAHAFTHTARSLGERLHREFRCQVCHSEETRLDVIIEHQGDQVVSLVRSDPRTPFKVICSCWKQLDATDLCGHVWAAVLEAQDCGWLRLESLSALEQDWRRVLDMLGEDTTQRTTRRGALQPPAAAFQMLYRYQWDNRPGERSPELRLFYQRLLKTGKYGKPKPFMTGRHQALDPEDRAIISLLRGARAPSLRETTFSTLSDRDRFELHGELLSQLLPRLCATGRLHVRAFEQEYGPFEYHPGCFELRLRLFRDGLEQQVVLDGYLIRDDQEVPLRSTALVLEDGFAFFKTGIVTPLDHHGAFPWLAYFKNRGAIRAGEGDAAVLMEALLKTPALPPVTVGEIEGVTIADPIAPRPRLIVRRPMLAGEPARLACELSFRYSEQEISAAAKGSGRRREDGTFLIRDRQLEVRALDLLRQAGCVVQIEGGAPRIRLEPSRLPECVTRLLDEDWLVEADGRLQRPASDFKLSIKSGIDWFDLRGEVHFGDEQIDLSELLQSLKRGERTVRLGDGSVGIMPQDWLRRFDLLGSLGRTLKSGLRLRRSQGFLLDLLLAEKQQVRLDTRFQELRQQLGRLRELEPCVEASGFGGVLRDYQRIGLAWLRFLHEFGLGGCLADDMGLGKTVQLLAHLDRLREEGRLTGPALIVAPLSVVRNWVEEAGRFTPKLRVLEYTGPDRGRLDDRLASVDLVITTYGLLRSDILKLKERHFSHAVLDEAQAIKNADSQTAKAARLIKADHRLALSGTPIENHLGELWSLFEFLNPGMLGQSRTFKAMIGKGGRSIDESTRQSLGRALAPFILRRAKGEVATELPEREEQTLYCDFGPEQRALYDSLRKHYSQVLSRRASDESFGKNKLHVLEALLRLRQAACHPGLLDVKRSDQPSAKLEVLIPMVQEIVDEGHKLLIFSQFTSLLDIVQTRLDAEQLVYERLDGSTRNRPARVERFQTDPACPIFLISLKAGGLGLNLTAAGYVFILDPWWNPAVEAQAIDRAHRIGQARKVMAYRLIGRDSVEEKILELQQSKRDLAEAIVSGQGSFLQDLTEQDLELLLS